MLHGRASSELCVYSTEYVLYDVYCYVPYLFVLSLRTEYALLVFLSSLDQSSLALFRASVEYLSIHNLVIYPGVIPSNNLRSMAYGIYRLYTHIYIPTYNK